MALLKKLSAEGGMDLAFERWKFGLLATKRAEFYEMMGSLIKDGKPLDSALRELQNRFKQKKRPMGVLLRVWSQAMSEGKKFAQAMEGYTTETERTVLAAGERSGDLTKGFEQAAAIARSTAAIKATLRAELSAPIIQTMVLLAMLIGFSVEIAPQLRHSIPDWAFDGSQRALFTLSSVVAKVWYYVLPAIGLALYAAVWSMSRYTGAVRRYLDRLPPWSVYKIHASATFMISLSALIKAGVPVDSAIQFIKKQSDPWMREHLSVMVGRLKAGEEQGAAMDTGLLSDRVADMVAIYSKTANFDAAISNIGQMAMDDGLSNIKAIAATGRTVSIIAIGAMTAWIFLAMMGIGDAAQRANNDSQQPAVMQKR
jgi:type II secretory pathway component PulF